LSRIQLHNTQFEEGVESSTLQECEKLNKCGKEKASCIELRNAWFEEGVKSLTLEEREELNKRGEEKARGALHPKCRSEKRKVNSLPSLHLFFCVFFFSFLLEKKKTPSSSSLTFLFPTYLPPSYLLPTYLSLLSFSPLLPPSYLPLPFVFFCVTIAIAKKATATNYHHLFFYV